MRKVVIISGARTPIGRFGGALRSLPASELGAIAIKAALERAGLSPSHVDEVILGNALQAEEAGYAARLAALKAGIPQEVPAIAVNRQCSSGLEAINLAALAIRAEEAEVVVAGGLESMSTAPYFARNVRWDGLRMGNGVLDDSLVEGLSCPVNHYHMGVTAENVAATFEVTRADQDQLAFLSHQRAVKAWEEGRFASQVASVSVPQRRGSPVLVERDEQPRADTTLESLAALKPAFKKDGTVTPGNSSGINDGAAAVVVMSEERAKALGLKPRLAWVGRAIAGVDPALMGTGPVPAVRKALAKTGMSLKDIDLIELNEAFAAQALYCIRELGLDMERTNVNGSGISLGHPVGATGAVMTVKLMEELARQDKEVGLVTMCVGGGQGCATLFRRLS
ncbi:MAG: acetyl-CoA C-acetyltransferase [Chloroflexi bacterium]|nr:acetyl-CoA C-acetyltransferase [Chloroflexota bacterium]